MSRLKISQLELKDAISFQPSTVSPPYASFPYSSPKDSPSSSTTKISPVVLLVIVILAIIFFLSGLLHLLIRYLMKRPYSPSLSFPQSNRYHPDNNNTTSGTSDALQRQLQQLFRLHDSGLDQAVVDSLPVFYYKDIVGIKKEGFDCAVCLCEFSTQDKLRLLPLCSHAFHISCIDTWLLSNSTCPLCRGSLVGSSGYPFDGVGFDYYLADLSNGCLSGGDGGGDENGQSFRHKPSLMEESASERRVFSVRLGKFRSLNNVGGGGDSDCRKREELQGETSGSSHVVDARRCYSLGTYQYVLGESNLLVAASSDESIGGGGPGDSGRNIGGGIKVEKVREDSSGNNNNHNHNGLVVDGGDVFEGKKISRRHRGDSFSVSKIWMWSKKDRFPNSQVTANMDGGPHHVNVGLPLTNRVQALPL